MKYKSNTRNIVIATFGRQMGLAALVLLALQAIVWPVAPAQAQVACRPRAEVLENLANKYAEGPVAMGLTADGRVLEVMASESGSWTITVTTPHGVMCPLAAGEAWSKAPPRPRQAAGLDS